MTRLEDRYVADEGVVHLTGIQALIRLFCELHRWDTRDGRRTASYVSGYEGSPLGGLDLEIMRNHVLVDRHGVVFRPGLNEELAATAVQGTQLASQVGRLSVDGVTGFWYGKGPGLDRAGDALRHANLMGTSRTGGAVALVGDDPTAKSSTFPGASDLALTDLGMPTVYPSDPADIVRLGLHAVVMSRLSGLWTGMKIVTNVADGSSTLAAASLGQFSPVVPDLEIEGKAFEHAPTAHVIQPNLTPLEISLTGARLEVARRYARANELNSIERGPSDRVGLVAAGKTVSDLAQALDSLGLTAPERRARGVRVLRLGMSWPLDPEEVRYFADGLTEIVVLEEKRPLIETELRSILYGLSEAPVISGKQDGRGSRLLPMHGELSPTEITDALMRRLGEHESLLPPQRREKAGQDIVTLPLLTSRRTPYFCSGCPHNTSTSVPDGALVGGGIGCHALALTMDDQLVGNVVGTTQMGGEGAQWIGMAPFLDEGHLFQNIGDGTFFHSGSLAIRAAVAAGVNITYKLLYNSAVAMTGGQQAVGVSDLVDVCRMLQAEGVKRIVVTTDDVRRTRRQRFPKGVRVRSRRKIIEVQEELEQTPGVTVLIHDQECATELRRKRRRGIVEDPDEHVIINERVCEGCGDCGQKSNCLSVQPVETEFGRKTRIDQGSCNKDYTCLEGDCPSFITVRSSDAAFRSAKRTDISASDLPEPTTRVPVDRFNMRIMGIGGTGVVTIAQVVATAAALAGREVRTLDQTGLAQKGGAVVSDVRITHHPVIESNKLVNGEAHLYLGCDLLVAADRGNLSVCDPVMTVGVVSTAEVATGSMVVDPATSYPSQGDLRHALTAAMRTGGVRLVDAREVTTRIFGDDRVSNVFLLGVAFQAGALPIESRWIEEALTLNGVAVETNIQAFRRGRQHVADPQGLESILDAGETPAPPSQVAVDLVDAVDVAPGSDIHGLLLRRVDELIDYQNPAYACSYLELVAKTLERERLTMPGMTELAEIVARNYFKLMAYKDEYEVARLSLHRDLEDRVRDDFGDVNSITYHLHPPALRALGMKRKLRLRRSAVPIFRVLRAMRRLRGTSLDPFGYARVRRVERRLVDEYQRGILDALATMTEETYPLVLQLAALPDLIRGYEDIKLASVERYEDAVEVALKAIGSAQASAVMHGGGA